ncbi:discoidin domain-containing protein [Paenibacillus mesophilus]|uniref:galactose-binding domain-containing protein n=1 Tax=Paenibacillus mesophilus TaxID=2582849 RepID=UPI0013053366|nr:discoidin domain-containing protein [Paenibacillus mesophilus]
MQAMNGFSGRLLGKLLICVLLELAVLMVGGTSGRVNAQDVNIAPAAVPTASSTSVSGGVTYSADKAVDGIKNSNDHRWVSKWDKAEPHWFQLEWRSDRKVGHVQVWSGSSTGINWQIAAFDVQYWDGSQWLTVASVAGNDKDGYLGQYNDISFTPVTTRKLRLHITDSSTIDTIARLLEIEVYETVPPQITIGVNAAVYHQAIDGWGGNIYTRQMRRFADADPNYLDNMLVGLTTTHVRNVSLWHKLEEQNDNADPAGFEWSQFAAGDTGELHEEFLGLQELMQRGIELHFSPWRFPNWIAGKPADYDWNGAQMELPAGMDDEYVESLAGYFLYAREHYGIVFDYISIVNEPLYGGVYIKGITAERYVSLTQKLKTKLEAHQYDAQYVGGETNSATTTSAAWTDTVFQNDTNNILDVLSVHSYDRTLEGLRSYRDTSAAYQAKLVVGEAEAQTHGQLSDKNTWLRAMRNALAYYDLLAYSNANLIYYFCYSATDTGGLTAYNHWTKTWYPVYDMLKHYHNGIPAGSVRIGADSVSDVLTLAFRKPDGKLELILINTSTATSHSVKLMVGDGTFDIRTSDDSLRYQPLPAVTSTAAGGTALTLTPNSITSLSQQ